MSLGEIGGRPIDTGNSQRRWRVRRGWRVEIDGGVGEASPLPGISRESHAEVGEALRRYLAGDRSIDLPPSARFAIETAELDRENFLGVDLDAPLRGSELGFDPGPGCGCVKLKVGPAAEWPSQRAAIDALLARRPELRVRLDFNGSLDPAEAGRIAAEISAARWPLDFVEDPTPFAQLIALPIPIAVDAAVPELLDAVVDSPASVAVLKPALLGGLRCTLELAARLRAGGMTPIVSHLLDGPIALSACGALARAIGGPLAHGVGPHPGLASYGPC